MTPEEQLKSITEERDALKAQLDTLASEVKALKSTVSDPQKEVVDLKAALADTNSVMAETIRSAMSREREAFREELAEKAEREQIISSLSKVVPRSELTKLLAKNPPLVQLKSNLEMLQAAGFRGNVGAGLGTTMLTSTQEAAYETNMKKLNIPEITFTRN